MTQFALHRSLPRAALSSIAMLLLAGAGAAAQDRVFTGRVDVAGLPINVTTVVVKCSVSAFRTLGEGETGIATALADDGTRRVAAPFTVRVRVIGTERPTTYSCMLGFRSAEGLRWAQTVSPLCRTSWYCGGPGTEVTKRGTLP
jgi:hypothetical protein